MIKKGDIETLKNIKNVILRMRLRLMFVFEMCASVWLVANSRKLMMKKFNIKMTRDDKT